MPSSSPAVPTRFGAAAALFFLSGAGALVVETTWLRWLRPLFGATPPAASATLVAFFAGQTLGALLGARLARRSPRPLASYARIEAAAVVWALLVPGLLAAGGGLMGLGYDRLRELPGALTALRFAIALLATLPAACCFGATLPVLGAAVIGERHQLGSRGAALYGVNTLGAALGAALAAFLLPDFFGVRAGYALGLALITLAALLAALLSRRNERRAAQRAAAKPDARSNERPQGASPAPTRATAGTQAPASSAQRAEGERSSADRPAQRAEGERSSADRRAQRAEGERSSADPRAQRAEGERSPEILAAVSGFGAFATQVLLVQAFGLVLDQSVYAFGVVLVTVLLTLGAGGLVVAFLERRGWIEPRRLAAFALLATAACLAAFPTLFVAATGGLDVLAGDRPWPGYLLSALGLAARTAGPALLAAALVLPATFALAARGGPDARPAARLGVLAAANTLGAIAGALAAPFLLVPLAGLWSALTAVAALYGAAVLLVPPKTPRTWALRVAVLGGGAAALLALAPPGRLPVQRLEAGERRLRLAQTPAGIVAAIAREDGLRIQIDNHYALGGTREQVHEERQGHLPLLLRPDARRVAYVGAATGISAGAVLAHPVEHLALVEIVPAVAEIAATTFRPYNRDVYGDARSEVILDDARNYLRSTGERFDVIVADLFVPWRAGTGSLYTREHFAAVRRRLTADGIFVQWLPLYQLSAGEFRIVAATFLEVFPDAALWRGDFFGRFPIVALVGHTGRPAGAAAISAAAARLGAAGETDRWVTDPVGVWALYLGPLASLRPALADVPINTDDRPRIEYRSARARAGAGGARPGPFVGLRLQAFAEQLRGVTALRGDPLHPDLPDVARRAAQAGYALQGAGALYVAGRLAESARALAAAGEGLPPHLLAAAPADPSAAEVWWPASATRDGD